jgi:hypothetical protein
MMLLMLVVSVLPALVLRSTVVEPGLVLTYWLLQGPLTSLSSTSTTGSSRSTGTSTSTITSTSTGTRVEFKCHLN